MNSMYFFVEFFARGGGGGSSSGGGGGGGSLILLLGYAPSHYVAAQAQRRIPKAIAYSVGLIFGVVYAVVLAILFRGTFYGLLMPVLSVVGGFAGAFGWFDNILKKAKRAKVSLKNAAAMDSSWDEASLVEYTTKVFYAYQNDWSNFNLAGIQNYTTSRYFLHIQLMMTALRNMGRQNIVENPKLISLSIVEAVDMPSDNQDYFVVQVVASARDRLFDHATNQDIYVDGSQFVEYWQFNRENKQWKLSGISQSTEEPLMLVQQLEAFAASNSMFYSPDWGWLLLPQRGQLFGSANFKKSDINNHVIGMYNNILTEIYTYIPVTASSKTLQGYTIAQAVLPKTYGNIVVKQKAKFRIFGRGKVKGLNKVTLEWPDFNKRYDVYASDIEQVTAFELLHPVYMEKLFALGYAVNIEVVDNVLYLYSEDKLATYDSMLSLLKDAFKEMRL